MSISFPRLGKFSAASFSLSFPSWDLCNANVYLLDVVKEIPLPILILMYFFFFLLFSLGVFHYPVSRLLNYFSVSSNILLIFSSVLFISVVVFKSDLLFYFLCVC